MRHACIVGAGLAGASVAHALALRGWQVTVLDSAATPAQGASGLPAGLMSARTGKKPNAEPSALSIEAAAATRRVLAQLQEGTDWAPSGAVVMPDGHVDMEVCWVKPAALVAHWLAHQNIRFEGSRVVGSSADLLELTRDNDAVVVAAGAGSLALLPEIDLHAVRGQVSMGAAADDTDWPSRPVRGDGTFIPRVAIDGRPMWLSAASYVHDRFDNEPSDTEHAENRARVHRLVGQQHPAVVQHIDQQFGRGELHAWVGLRCTTRTRQPVAQGMGEQLYAITGLGSRGITLAALLGQRLAARVDVECGSR